MIVDAFLANDEIDLAKFRITFLAGRVARFYVGVMELANLIASRWRGRAAICSKFWILSLAAGVKVKFSVSKEAHEL